MSSSKPPELFLPDVNVWFALTREDHQHRNSALEWWSDLGDRHVGFVRVTQFGLLRLLTNPMAMNQLPLTMLEAWAVYEKLFRDERVLFLREPEGIDAAFKRNTSLRSASPNLWADRWLVLLCYKRSAQQKGQQGSLASRPRAMSSRSVAMEWGLCRWARPSGLPFGRQLG